jgi:nitrogen fixation NifU-like protein
VAGLEDLYREIILDHYRSPRNRGELSVPPAHRVEGFNPLCGDEVVLYVEVEDGRVADIKVSGQGCSISQSSASMMTSAVKGRTVPETRALIRRFKGLMSIHEQALGGDADEADDVFGEGANGSDDAGEPDVKLGDLEALQGVVKFPVRIKCATLSWHTLTQALDESGN